MHAVTAPADPPRVRLVPSKPPARGVPAGHRPDGEQAQAIAHRQGQGPLVLLGGPGTGTTGTLVELVAARVERDGVAPDAVLVMAPTRTAAAALRDRLAARLDRTVREPLARTPHSYAFGLLRRALVLAGDVPPRLISGPEQDRVLADLLQGHEEGVGVVPSWPPSARDDVRVLRGFRDELRDLLMRAVERGLGPDDLAALGERERRPEWLAAADVLGEYLDVTALGTPGAYDPAAILDAASALLAADPDLLDAERARWSVVAVDDAQELTVAAERLLDQLAGGGRDLVLAGDPDSATQTFRGARPALLAGAAHRYPRADGRPAHTVVLRTVHRHGPALRAVAERVAARIGSAGTVAHRRATPSPDRTDDADRAADAAEPANAATGLIGAAGASVHVLASTAQEAAFVAQDLRRRHLVDGVPWGRMAVVVRSSRATEPLRRALGAAGVPVAVPPAEVPVRDEPAVVPLRLALRCVLDPAALTPAVAAELLAGPVGGVDTVALRRLRQALRSQELALGGVRHSDELLVEALTLPGSLVMLDPRLARGARRVAAVLDAGRQATDAPGATAETVLWALWQAAGLGEAWRRTALSGGPSGARADRDLDAVVSLFEAAARYVDRLPHAGPAQFLTYLEGQDLPADTLAERAPDGDAVSLVTAQGAAGREWDVVAVPGVQEGVWPDLRLRSSLLGAQSLADLLDGRGAGDDPGAAAGASVSAQRRAVLDDELRLFLVAVSRARHRLVVTAVRSEEELPSVFLDLVEPDPPDGAAAGAEVRPYTEVPRSITLPALVAHLRGVVTDPDAAPERRGRAAHRLARLALEGVPGADPADWYGLDQPSTDGPLRAPGEPVKVSPSRVEQFDRCGLRWLLETAGGTPASSTSQALGTLVHELAQEAAEKGRDGDRGYLLTLLRERIGRLGLGEGWVADRQRERAEQMVAKVAEYVALARSQGRELLAVERDVQVTVGRAVVRGQVDRLEQDAEGRLFVADLKTGRSAPARAELARHAQLGVYQLAVEAGGFEEFAAGARSGGAALVQLGTKTKKVGVQQQPALSEDGDPGWAHQLVAQAAEGMAAAGFEAKGNAMCRMCAVRRSCPLQPEGRQVGR